MVNLFTPIFFFDVGYPKMGPIRTNYNKNAFLNTLTVKMHSASLEKMFFVKMFRRKNESKRKERKRKGGKEGLEDN